MTRKIAIVGMGHSRRVPDDPSWEVWGLNAAQQIDDLHWRRDGTFRADRWWQLHPTFACNAGELDWMEGLASGRYPAVPTYVWAHDIPDWRAKYPGIERHILPYPLDAVVKSSGGRAWLSNTFCLQMALAIMEEVDVIGLWGVELLSRGRELVVERPALTYWLGAAAAVGIAVELPAKSTLAQQKVYGYEYWDEARAVAGLTEQVMRGDGENLDSIEQVERAYAKVTQLQTKD